MTLKTTFTPSLDYQEMEPLYALLSPNAMMDYACYASNPTEIRVPSSKKTSKKSRVDYDRYDDFLDLDDIGDSPIGEVKGSFEIRLHDVCKYIVEQSKKGDKAHDYADLVAHINKMYGEPRRLSFTLKNLVNQSDLLGNKIANDPKYSNAADRLGEFFNDIKIQMGRHYTLDYDFQKSFYREAPHELVSTNQSVTAVVVAMDELARYRKKNFPTTSVTETLREKMTILKHNLERDLKYLRPMVARPHREFNDENTKSALTWLENTVEAINSLSYVLEQKIKADDPIDKLIAERTRGIMDYLMNKTSDKSRNKPGTGR